MGSNVKSINEKDQPSDQNLKHEYLVIFKFNVIAPNGQKAIIEAEGPYKAAEPIKLDNLLGLKKYIVDTIVTPSFKVMMKPEEVRIVNIVRLGV